MNIKELADFLNLSTATVSKALNNKNDISNHTRKRVLEAATKLGYRANASARYLRSGKTGVVALLLPTADSGNIHTASFFIRIARGLQLSLRDSDIDPVIYITTDREGELHLLQKIIEQNRTDVVILTDTVINDDRILLLNELSFPFVTMGQSRTLNGHFNWVDFHHEEMGRQCVRYASRLGAKRIAVATIGGDSMHGQQFLDGCLQELSVQGQQPDDGLIFFGAVTMLSGEEAAMHFMRQTERPDFIIFINDFLLMGASKVFAAMPECGLTQKSMICATASSDFSPIASPETCLFSIDHEEVGRQLGEAVLRITEGNKASKGILMELQAKI